MTRLWPASGNGSGSQFGRIVFCLLVTALVACANAGLAVSTTPEELARRAVSADGPTAEAAMARLREMGADGLEALFQVHKPMLDRVTDGTDVPHDDPHWQRICRALDTVGGQRDCYTSRLFWYTDFDAARQAAAESGRPILSLRLLGKLTDEYSCANSRFFRTALYANREVADLMRDRFVLHWKSVRPVPRVTIDFGDGRKVERTLTGNSIHYILDSRGRPVEALPGLYGPGAFQRGLIQAEQVAKAFGRLEPKDWPGRIRNYHARQLAAVVSAWRNDLDQLGVKVEEPAKDQDRTNAGKAVPARAAALIAFSKSAVEVPILERLAGMDLTASTERLEDATDAETWKRLAELHIEDARLDDGSIALMRKQNPHLCSRTSKLAGADPLLPMVRNFEMSIAMDTVRNRYLLHREIHRQLAENEPTADVDTLNEWVYAELFLTPSSDPWLGLVPDDTYTALETAAVVQ